MSDLMGNLKTGFLVSRHLIMPPTFEKLGRHIALGLSASVLMCVPLF